MCTAKVPLIRLNPRKTVTCPFKLDCLGQCLFSEDTFPVIISGVTASAYSLLSLLLGSFQNLKSPSFIPPNRHSFS